MRRRVIRSMVLLSWGVSLRWWGRRHMPDDKSPARAALHRVVPVVRFRQQPLEVVLRECERVARVPIIVNWAALEEAAIRPNTPVTLHRYDGTLGDALARIAAQLPSGD